MVSENAPRLRSHRPRCRGTVEDHLAFDVRDLIRRHVFDHPVGTVWRCGFQWPWIITLKLNQMSIDLTLRSGRTEIVPLVWARCGAIGNRLRLRCPRCRRRACKLHQVGQTACCRKCGDLWYASQRCSANGRRCLKAQRLRFKLGGPAALKLLDGLDAFPPRPRGMWKRTYERLRRRDERATRRSSRWYWRDPDWSVLAPR